MGKGCRSFKKGDVVRGLLITANPYKIQGDKNYRSIVKCTLCDSKPYEIVLSEINRHVFDGCGCQKNRSNSPRWKSFEDWCKENNREDILDLWDYDLNNKLPSQVSSCTSDSYYFKCKVGKHESTLHKIICVTTEFKNKKLCIKCNSFAQYAIDKYGEDVLDIYWDYKKNTFDPWEIAHNARTTIWIKCINTDYHGSFDTYPQVFFKTDGGCPYCNRKRIHPKDSFAYYYIQKYGKNFLDKYWDFDKNAFSPWSIAIQTNMDYIYLKCEKHGTYSVLPSNFYKLGITCPECTREQDKSKLQGKVEDYIKDKYGYNISHEYNCSIIIRSPKTNRWLPYDNDVIVNADTHLIIEVMGEQHYNVNAGWIRKSAKEYKMSKEKILSEVQWRDEYKKQYALSKGYYYLEIPYWTEQDGSYKTLIDEKIQSILTI